MCENWVEKGRELLLLLLKSWGVRGSHLAHTSPCHLETSVFPLFPRTSLQPLGAAATAVALGFGELQSVEEINNVLGTTLLLPSLICLTQGKL